MHSICFITSNDHHEPTIIGKATAALVREQHYVTIKSYDEFLANPVMPGDTFIIVDVKSNYEQGLRVATELGDFDASFGAITGNGIDFMRLQTQLLGKGAKGCVTADDSRLAVDAIVMFAQNNRPASSLDRKWFSSQAYLDRENKVLISANGKKQKLTTGEYNIFLCLLNANGASVTTEKLRQVGPLDGEGNIVAVYISRLNKKLRMLEEVDVIKSVRNVGYKANIVHPNALTKPLNGAVSGPSPSPTR